MEKEYIVSLGMNPLKIRTELFWIYDDMEEPMMLDLRVLYKLNELKIFGYRTKISFFLRGPKRFFKESQI